MVYTMRCLESSLRKNFNAKEERQMSQLLNICVLQTCIKEAYGTELLEIKVTSEAQSVTTLSGYWCKVGKLNEGKKDKAVSSTTEEHAQTSQLALNTAVMDVLQIQKYQWEEENLWLSRKGKQWKTKLLSIRGECQKKALQKLLPKSKLIQVFYKQDFFVVPHFSKLNIYKIHVDTALHSNFQYL